MILAAGLTPAWQHIHLFDEFVPGEVNLAVEVQRCASGKVLNVGMALHSLGAEARTLAFVGGDAGESIKSDFAVRQIDARWVATSTPTRVCTTILDRKTRVTTELVENSAEVRPEELTQFGAAFGEEAGVADLVVLSGSLPASTPMTFYADLLRRTSARSILDVRGPELLEALAHRPLLVKPNRSELESTVGRPLDDDGELLSAMRELNERGAEWVVVTDGSRPVWASSAGSAYKLVPPPTETVNPIGCGDCMAAGIAWAIGEGKDPLDAIRLGMAAAADNLSQLLPARLSRERVHALAEHIDVSALA